MTPRIAPSAHACRGVTGRGGAATARRGRRRRWTGDVVGSNGPVGCGRPLDLRRGSTPWRTRRVSGSAECSGRCPGQLTVPHVRGATEDSPSRGCGARQRRGRLQNDAVTEDGGEHVFGYSERRTPARRSRGPRSGSGRTLPPGPFGTIPAWCPGRPHAGAPATPDALCPPGRRPCPYSELWALQETVLTTKLHRPASTSGRAPRECRTTSPGCGPHQPSWIGRRLALDSDPWRRVPPRLRVVHERVSTGGDPDDPDVVTTSLPRAAGVRWGGRGATGHRPLSRRRTGHWVSKEA